MFEIIRLSARNYVHYKKLDINFKELSDNLVFITGRNLDTAGSVSNGSGKSVIGDLITDLLFDKTIRRHSSKSFIGSFAKWNYGLIQVENSITKDLYIIKKYRDHPLTGNWKGHRDCHIESDWLLIYRITADDLYLERTGSHAELFRK